MGVDFGMQQPRNCCDSLGASGKSAFASGTFAGALEAAPETIRSSAGCASHFGAMMKNNAATMTNDDEVRNDEVLTNAPIALLLSHASGFWLVQAVSIPGMSQPFNKCGRRPIGVPSQLGP
jgi:hypothetical protein